MNNTTKDALNQNSFDIKINSEEYILNFGISKNNNKLSMLIRSKNVFSLDYYQFESSYEEFINSNKFLSAFESLDEIQEELNKYFSESKYYKINFENEKKIIKITLDFIFGTKTKKIEIILKKPEISIDTIIKQNEKIKEQEIKIKELEKSLQEYKANNDLLKQILSEVLEIKKNLNFSCSCDIDSKIIKKKSELDLINIVMEFQILYQLCKELKDIVLEVTLSHNGILILDVKVEIISFYLV